ncbi:MAG TPA: hypothetical protein VMD98_03230 [Bryocella sp.]|nr:hypothetical protein [Bryocella sp.]
MARFGAGTFDSQPGLLCSATVSHFSFPGEVVMVQQIHPWLALGVMISTAATDAVYVKFSAAVAARRRVPAATWSGLWYLLSAFAVISYTRTWVYVVFAALGSWIGAYLAVTHSTRQEKSTPPAGAEHRW